ncbi:MAG: hypothetical protein ACJATK_001701 [Paracoccaceae bacterium]|jgi:hypothetical protein
MVVFLYLEIALANDALEILQSTLPIYYQPNYYKLSYYKLGYYKLGSTKSIA